MAEEFSIGDTIEVHGPDGSLLGRARVTKLLNGGTSLVVEYELPQHFLLGQREDIVQAYRCRKAGDGQK